MLLDVVMLFHLPFLYPSHFVHPEAIGKFRQVNPGVTFSLLETLSISID
jgi:hypothetical protein